MTLLWVWCLLQVWFGNSGMPLKTSFVTLLDPVDLFPFLRLLKTQC